MKDTVAVPGDNNIPSEESKPAMKVGETVGYTPLPGDSDLKSEKPLPAIIVAINEDNTMDLQVFNNRAHGSLLRKAVLPDAPVTE